ncbi:cytochrome b/b6 domain-containing protein [Thermophagus xiamenensis]|uniref:Thiosulfate reductase cytochrome b subunit n=1 Tax=Thermophagus xiamenensis TaxID=385682 RepID=A0A1I1UDE5_9BACT|nr:cytochrome b/b6 domain-containing protein [Thermophagus xiamenensis]SFD68767.1 Thiosulfate reductase cytochrome b subunit [Thermophagus xiamenensis]
MARVYIYRKFERFWHWTQAILIFYLALTGFEIHGSYSFLGYEQAVKSHRVAAWMLLILIAFSIFWHFTTGEWRQYIPTFSKLKAQIRYYTVGIFKGENHPTRKSPKSKLNPLQALTYLGFKLVMAPMLIITGLIYMFYRTIDANNMVIISDIPLETIASIHTLGAYLIIMFAIVHVYMTTTGETPTSNIRAMITGYEDLETDDDSSKATDTK